MSTKHLNMSEQTRLKHGRSNDEHEYFYRFLLNSPSYQLAHRFMTGKLRSTDQIDRVVSWDQVLKTYSLCGDIFSKPFLIWWDEIGRDLFYKKSDDGTFTANGPMPLLVNKINELTLHEALKLIRFKPQLEQRHGRKIENWSLGVYSGIHSIWTKQLKFGDKKTPENLVPRNTLGILVSKKLRFALYMCEHAARGKFPLVTPFNSGLALDFATSYEATSNYFELSTIDTRERRKLGLHIPRPKRYRDSANYYREKSKLKRAVELELKKLKMIR